MPFPPSSNKKANFLRALAGDKAKGQMPSQGLQNPMMPMNSGIKPPMTQPGMVNPTMNPVPMVHIPQPKAPNFQPSNSTGVPSLPSGPKLPKFGKMRNSLKNGPFKK